MYPLSIFLFVISSSSDNLIVGLSYGTKKVKISLINNFIISCISGIGTFLSMLFGKMFLQIIPIEYSSIIGGALLILFGIYMLFNLLKSQKSSDKPTGNITEYERYEKTLRNPEIIDINNSKTIEFKESIVLGIILCLNNICLGIGASITGLNIFITSIFTFISSLIFLPLGYILGKKIVSEKLSRYSEIISICIIIILGIYEMFI